MLLAKIQRQRGKKFILSNFDATKTMYVQIHLLLLTKVVPRRYEQNLCQSCGKVATKRVFSLYFNVNFMTSQRRQFSSDFDENTFIQQRRSLRSYSYQIHACLQLIYEAPKKKNYYPRKLTKISTFSCFRQSATQKR